MKRLVISMLFVAGTMLGCAQNHFNVPVENFAEKVKVLGVAPIFVDADSDIIHPQKDSLVPVIADLNRKYEPLLVRKLQSTGNFYAVTLLADEPRQLFSVLKARREKRNDANVEYNKYFWKNDEIAACIKRNRLDALMLVTVSGLTKKSKISSSNLLMSLETNYNFLMMSAQIVGPDGTVLWEYPNFRGQILLPYYPLVNLQYPDFSESEANQSHTTEVRFKSVDGIRRTLELKKKDLLFRETAEPEIYGRLFDEMISLIGYSVDKKAKDKPQPQVTGAVPPPMSRSTAVQPPASAPAPPVEAPVNAPLPKRSLEVPVAPTSPSNEIVPATTSTL
ncbi:MAG: hypothetical protein PHF56_10600 [Desulfuromonadaceae bacterium]|nr:hypothetical protein [Desulfuromonadaceae bacterium]